MSRPITPIPIGCSFAFLSCQMDYSYIPIPKPQQKPKQQHQTNPKTQWSKSEKISLKNRTIPTHLKSISQNIYERRKEDGWDGVRGVESSVLKYLEMGKLTRQEREYRENVERNQFMQKIEKSEIIWQLSDNSNGVDKLEKLMPLCQNSTTIIQKLHSQKYPPPVFIDEFTLNTKNNVHNHGEPLSRKSETNNNNPIPCDNKRNRSESNEDNNSWKKYSNGNDHVGRYIKRSMTEENDRKRKRSTMDSFKLNSRQIQIPFIYRSQMMNTTNKYQAPSHSYPNPLSPKHLSSKKPEIFLKKHSQNQQLTEIHQNIPPSLEKTKNSKMLQLSTQVESAGTKSKVYTLIQDVKQSVTLNHIRKLSSPQFAKKPSILNDEMSRNIESNIGVIQKNQLSIDTGYDIDSFKVGSSRGGGGMMKKMTMKSLPLQRLM